MKSRVLSLIVVVFVCGSVLGGESLATTDSGDNAALLYLKAVEQYEPTDDMINSLIKLRKGDIGLNDEIKEFVQKNKCVIDTVVEASKIEKCDWGLDKSVNFDMGKLPLAKIRGIVHLINADAMILAEKGEYESAMSRYVCIYKIASHVNGSYIVSYLVGTHLNSVANMGLIRLLSDMEINVKTLEMFQDKLSEIDSIGFSIEPSWEFEKRMTCSYFTLENVDGLAKDLGMPEIKEKVLGENEAFFAKNRACWNRAMDDVKAAFGLGYPEAFAKIEQVTNEVRKDVMRTEAPLVGLFFPACERIYSLDIKCRNEYNAVKAGAAVYMIKAKSGKLPDSLPVGLPVDLFSGKDFEYKKSGDGFVLKCVGKDLSKDEIYEYKFKVKD